MADLCPNCNSTDVQHALDSAYCLGCGKKITYEADGVLGKSDEQIADVSKPADSSLATPTATPVYAERESDRQPVIDTNQEPVPTDAEPGVNHKPAPDPEAQNVAGELSDETPAEKTHGGPDDTPRTAVLTARGKPKKAALGDDAEAHTTADPPKAKKNATVRKDS